MYYNPQKVIDWAQGERIASDTAAYLLNVMGKWVANAPAAAT